MAKGKITLIVDGDSHTKEEFGKTLKAWIDINNGFVFPCIDEELKESDMFRITDVVWTWESEDDK